MANSFSDLSFDSEKIYGAGLRDVACFAKEQVGGKLPFRGLQADRAPWAVGTGVVESVGAEPPRESEAA